MTKLEEAQDRLEKFLVANPKMRAKQIEIEKVLNASGDTLGRLNAIKSMILDSLEELSEAAGDLEKAAESAASVVASGAIKNEQQ